MQYNETWVYYEYTLAKNDQFAIVEFLVLFSYKI